MMSSTSLQETRARLLNVMNLALGTNIDSSGVDLGTRLDELVGFDSLTLIEWTAAVEAEFRITIPPGRLRLDFLVDLDAMAEYLDNASAMPAGRQP